jgi:hypothetical protein
LNRNQTRLLGISLAALLALPAAADTGPLFTFGFTDLDGDYTRNGNSGSFTAVASALANGGPFDSSGDVTRVVPVAGTAEFNFGFVAGADPANFVMNMNITGISANQAQGSGSFTVTDANGDTISGTLSGSWSRLGSVFADFRGLVSNVALSNASADGTFDGPDGGSFSMDFGTANPLNGAIITLVTGGWFQSSFQDKDTQIEASIVPAPGAVLLGALGLGLLARVKRSVA